MFAKFYWIIEIEYFWEINNTFINIYIKIDL